MFFHVFPGFLLHLTVLCFQNGLWFKMAPRRWPWWKLDWGTSKTSWQSKTRPWPRRWGMGIIGYPYSLYSLYFPIQWG